VNWREQPIVVIDTETTGTDVAVDRVVEVAAVVMLRGEIAETFARLVNPCRPVGESVNVHGITDADLAMAPSFTEIAYEFGAFITDKIAAGYNARFDRAMLIGEFLRANIHPPACLVGGDRATWIDPMVWAKARDPYAKGQGRFKLGAVAARLGVEQSDAHRALGDCITTARVIWNLAIEANGLPEDLDALLLEQRARAAKQEAEFLTFLLRKRAEENAA
jgi:DNA polymerase III epsilon subunit family exonuclease